MSNTALKKKWRGGKERNRKKGGYCVLAEVLNMDSFAYATKV